MIFELIALAFAISFIVFASVRLKWNTFFLLIGVSTALGFVLVEEPTMVVPLISEGFGELLSKITLIVIFGALLGNLLQASGAMDRIGAALFTGPMKRYPSLALGLAGIIVGIPVFCDAGYVVLSHIPRKMAVAGKQKVSMTIMLAGGLYLSHTLIPPTPGPTAALAAFGLTSLIAKIILVGFLIALLSLIILWLCTGADSAAETPIASGAVNKGWIKSLVPLFVPIGLIGIGSLPDYWLGWPQNLIAVLSQPAVALAVGCGMAVASFWRQLDGKLSEIIEKSIRQAMPILLLTGAGGALGKIMSQSNLVKSADFDIQFGHSSGVVLLAVAFGAACLFKTLQGSSTGAMVIASALIAPLADGVSEVLLISLMLAIGAGALAISHTNDSFFWVIAKFEDWTTAQALKRWSAATVLLSICAFLFVISFYLLFQ